MGSRLPPPLNLPCKYRRKSLTASDVDDEMDYRAPMSTVPQGNTAGSSPINIIRPRTPASPGSLSLREYDTSPIWTGKSSAYVSRIHRSGKNSRNVNFGTPHNYMEPVASSSFRQSSYHDYQSYSEYQPSEVFMSDSDGELEPPLTSDFDISSYSNSSSVSSPVDLRSPLSLPDHEETKDNGDILYDGMEMYEATERTTWFSTSAERGRWRDEPIRIPVPYSLESKQKVGLQPSSAQNADGPRLEPRCLPFPSSPPSPRPRTPAVSRTSIASLLCNDNAPVTINSAPDRPTTPLQTDVSLLLSAPATPDPPQNRSSIAFLLSPEPSCLPQTNSVTQYEEKFAQNVIFHMSTSLPDQRPPASEGEHAAADKEEKAQNDIQPDVDDLPQSSPLSSPVSISLDVEVCNSSMKSVADQVACETASLSTNLPEIPTRLVRTASLIRSSRSLSPAVPFACSAGRSTRDPSNDDLEPAARSPDCLLFTSPRSSLRRSDIPDIILHLPPQPYGDVSSLQMALQQKTQTENTGTASPSVGDQTRCRMEDIHQNPTDDMIFVGAEFMDVDAPPPPTASLTETRESSVLRLQSPFGQHDAIPSPTIFAESPLSSFSHRSSSSLQPSPLSLTAELPTDLSLPLLPNVDVELVAVPPISTSPVASQAAASVFLLESPLSSPLSPAASLPPSSPAIQPCLSSPTPVFEKLSSPAKPDKSQELAQPFTNKKNRPHPGQQPMGEVHESELPVSLTVEERRREEADQQRCAEEVWREMEDGLGATASGSTKIGKSKPVVAVEDDEDARLKATTPAVEKRRTVLGDKEGPRNKKPKLATSEQKRKTERPASPARDAPPPAVHDRPEKCKAPKEKGKRRVRPAEIKDEELDASGLTDAKPSKSTVKAKETVKAKSELTSRREPSRVTPTSRRSDSPSRDTTPRVDDDFPGSSSSLTAASSSLILGLVIESLATSRASSLPVSALLHAQPALRTYDIKTVLHVLEEGQKTSGVFGKVDSSGKDDQGRPLEPQWFYVPERDEDRERAALMGSLMPRPGKRSETKKYKQYYWRPLGKISRWDPEDAI